jgi:hypothetical protein
MRKCTSCQEEKEETFFYKSGKKTQSKCKSCFNKYCADRWKQKKKDMVEYKGGLCLDCGVESTDANYVIFDFHHLDPNEKDADWKKIRQMSKIKQKLELDKCVLLCSNCHRLRHSTLI